MASGLTLEIGVTPSRTCLTCEWKTPIAEESDVNNLNQARILKGTTSAWASNRAQKVTSSRKDSKVSRSWYRHRRRKMRSRWRHTLIWYSTSWAGSSLTSSTWSYRMSRLMRYFFGDAKPFKSRNQDSTYYWQSSNQIKRIHLRCSLSMSSWWCHFRSAAIDFANLASVTWLS